mmetsp:Transcript_10820/g.37315  ORF Transcript_10820/g.37315 Transcript_10820/m.37315 type:complete len:121 (+) Transcript_10820:132-494(+)
MAEMADVIDFADPPSSMKGHRACLRCGLVKCFDQFFQDGCENCPFLELAERQDRVASCTTASFDGVVAMMKPEESWIARWEGINRSLPGCYAMKLTGEMPEQIRQFLHDKRISSRVTQAE